MNGRQIRIAINILIPSPAHRAQGRQWKHTTMTAERRTKERSIQQYKVGMPFGMPFHALYCGPRRDTDPRWVPATVTKVFGTRRVNVKVYPKGPTWRRRVEQLRLRHFSAEDEESDDIPSTSSLSAAVNARTLQDSHLQPSGSGVEILTATTEEVAKKKRKRNPRMSIGDEYGQHTGPEGLNGYKTKNIRTLSPNMERLG